MKPYALPLLIAILLLTSLACQITVNAPDLPNVEIMDQPETLNINEAAPLSSPASLVISMSAGKLNLAGGGSSFVSGSVRYNVANQKPTVTRDGSQITIDQNELKSALNLGRDVINEWDLRLGTTPTALKINAGAYEGKLLLGGIPLTNLEINDGASKSEIRFDDPNPQVMETLSYKTGASQVELINLGNANFEEMTFDSGAGSYTLDFGGALQRDASVRLNSGVSNTKIIIPEGTRARIEVNGSLNNVTQSGTWTVKDRLYEAQGSGPLLSIRVEMSVGQLELVHR
jgi:hypothetical protein